jgi:hypothetical protein
MVAVVRATMHSREARPRASPTSVLRIDMAPWVLHVVGMGDTGAVVLWKPPRLEDINVEADTDTLERGWHTPREGRSGKTPCPGTEERQPY